MSDEYVDRITRFLTSHSINNFYFERLAKHRVVVIPYKGRLNKVVFPLTGSDWRGPANTISTIRHVLGLFEPKPSRVDSTRRTGRYINNVRRSSHAATFSEPIAPQPDKFIGPLMILKARLEAAQTIPNVVPTVEANTATDKSERIAAETPRLSQQIGYPEI